MGLSPKTVFGSAPNGGICGRISGGKADRVHQGGKLLCARGKPIYVFTRTDSKEIGALAKVYPDCLVNLLPNQLAGFNKQPTTKLSKNMQLIPTLDAAT